MGEAKVKRESVKGFCLRAVAFLLSLVSAVNLVVAQDRADTQDAAFVAQNITGGDRLDLLFTIRGVQVDKTARTASEARRLALEEAEEKAFNLLITKLTQPEDRDKLPELAHSERVVFVRGVEVVEEKTALRRYVATLDISFEPDLVSQFFAHNGVAHVFGAGAGVMVFHAHQSGAKLALWQSMSAKETVYPDVNWNNRLRQYHFAPGNLLDRVALSAQQVVNMDSEAALTLAATYADSAALLLYTRWTQATGSLFYRAFVTSGAQPFEGDLKADTEEDALKRILDFVLRSVDADWRGKLLVDVSQSGLVEIEIPVLNARRWFDVQARLKEISLVASLDLVELNMPRSRYQLAYRGALNQLKVAVGEAGLVMERREGSYIIYHPEEQG